VRHGKASRILHDGRGIFRGLPQGFAAVRYHSLVVEPGSLPPDLRVTATAEEDGQIMGLRHTQRPSYGVQFHPESHGSEWGKALLANFRDITGGRRRSGGSPRADGIAPAAAGPAGITVPAPPAHARELPWNDPEAVFLRIFRQAPAAFWLDSLVAPVPGEPLFTYMGSGARLVEVRGDRAEEIELENHQAPRRAAVHQGDPFRILDGLLRRPAPACEAAAEVPYPLPKGLPGDAAFRGGWVGWLGYELKRHAGGGDLPGTPASGLPDALFVDASRLLVFDHAARRVHALVFPSGGTVARDGGNAEPASAEGPGVAGAGSSPAGAGPTPADLAWLDETCAAWPSVDDAPPLRLERGEGADAGFHALRLPVTLATGKAGYLASIRSLQEAILRGETYEACLTNEARVSAEDAAGADPLLVYRILRRTNPAPYAAFLRFPQATLLSASPERFLKLDAEGNLACRPIKGTRRRGATPGEDEALRADLASHPKDRSENLMILDLVRNDFGRVCAPGTVRVPEAMAVEAHPAVFQMVSTVAGRLLPGIGALEAARACFPGGSMTGAPKKRTMELLEAEEKRPRGIFSGALGWLGRDGAMDLGMVIRTLVCQDGAYRVGCGGAVLAESDPEAEFEEALLKATAPLRALELAVRGESGAWTLRA
jgi:para-aminobenzoate synthetase